MGMVMSASPICAALLAVSGFLVLPEVALASSQVGYAQALLSEHSARTARFRATANDGPLFASASELIGSSVLVCPPTGMDCMVVGTIHDLVVECASGSVTHVILSTAGDGFGGDTLRRIPFDRSSFELSVTERPRFFVTAAQLDASAEVTPVMLAAYRSETIVGRQPLIREAYLSTQPKDDSPLAGGVCLFMLASELDDLVVRSTADPADGITQGRAGASLGLVDEVWIDCSRGRVVYCSLHHEERLVLLPMVLCLPTFDVETRTLFLATPCSALRLTEAPALVAQLDRTVANAGFRRSVAEFYARAEANPIRAVARDRALGRR
jgi:sporulation protein YlmC with PRC-barrel domain